MQPSHLRVFNGDDAQPEPESNQALTVQVVVDAYLAEKKIKADSGLQSKKTLDRAQRRLRSFANCYGDVDATHCRQQHLVKWISDHPEWKSSHTKSDAAGAVVSCFNWAVETSLISASPFRKPKGLWPALMPRVAITAADYQKIIEAASRRGYAKSREAFLFGMLFLWETGARTCEMRNLQWSDINWDNGIASLCIHKTLATSGECRLIALSDTIITKLIQVWNRRGKKAGHVFVNGRDNPWQGDRFANLFRKAAKLAGVRLDISPYCLRHGFTVKAIENGLTSRQTADLLGHKSTRYVDWYGRSTRQHGNYLRANLERVHGKRTDG